MGTDAAPVSFGIKISQIGLSYERILELWTEADRLEAFEHAWLWDHLIPLRGDVGADALEAWTLLAALAARTERIRLGVMVTSNRLRSPTLLAKMAATVDVLSGGRLEFGLGAGGSRVAGPNPAVAEFEAYGVPLVSPGEATRDLDESLRIIRRMWSEAEPFDFDGPRTTLRGAICAPRPLQQPAPPIVLGAWGDRSMRVVAEHADVWNFPFASVDDFRDRGAFLDRACEEIGRDPSEVARSVQVLVRTSEPSEPAAARELIGEMIEAGATQVVLAPALGDHSLEWLVEELVDPFRAG